MKRWHSHPEEHCSICGKKRDQKYSFFEYSYQFYGCSGSGNLALCTKCANRVLKPIHEIIDHAHNEEIRKFEVKGIMLK